MKILFKTNMISYVIFIFFKQNILIAINNGQSQKLVQILIKKCHVFITRGVVLAVTMTFQSNVLNQLCIPSDNLLTCRSDDE